MRSPWECARSIALLTNSSSGRYRLHSRSHSQFRCEGGSCQERETDTDDTRHPTEAVEGLTQDSAAEKPAREVGGEIEAAGGAAVGSGGAADETRGCGLGKEGADADENHAGQHRCQARCNEQWQAERRCCQAAPQSCLRA